MSEKDARETLQKIRAYYAASPQRTQRAALAYAFVALHQMLVAAADGQLSAYWVSGSDEQKIKTHFDIPDQFLVAAVLAIGYGNGTPPTAPKLPFESLVYQEKFGVALFRD